MRISVGTSIVFWLVAMLALAWNAMGCLNFFWQVTESGLENLPPEYREFAAARPIWSTAGFGLSVISGLAGALLMLIKNRTAGMMFVLSAIGAVVAAIPAIGWPNQSLLYGAIMSAVLAGYFAFFCFRRLK